MPNGTATRPPGPEALLGRLADTLRDLDLTCREYFLGGDIDLASITIAVVVATLPPIALLDYSYYGLNDDFYSTVAIEAALVVFSLIIAQIIRRRRAVRTYEWTIWLWNIVLAVLFVGFTFAQSDRLTENIFFSILVLIATYVTLPNRFVFTITPAAILTLGGLAALATIPGPVTFQNRYVFGLSLVVLNVGGIVIFARNQHFKRREYYAQRNEHVARQLYETLSQTDSLTGLLNRRSFLDHAQQALNRYQRYHTLFCLIIFDLDFFKQVNDTHGHLAGDEALRRFAAVLQAEKRNSDEVGRLGGEEFGLLLAETTQVTALAAATRMQQAVRQLRLPVPAGEFQVTFSAGVSEVQPGDQVLDDLMRRADRALYHAKVLGRDRIEMG